MTDEALFYRRFVEDVRRCAAGRANASVAEIERRVRVAMIAPPSARERRWARVVAAVNDLLTAIRPLVAERAIDLGAVRRLRAFVHENADLGRPRDLSLGDFQVARRAESVLVTASGRAYLVYAPLTQPVRRPVAALDEVVPSATRRFAEWAVYTLCGGAAMVALWFAFVAPV